MSDLAKSAALYDAALEPLGLTRVWTASDAIGYGRANGDDCFAIKQALGEVVLPHDRMHLAFAAATRQAAQGFYEAAIARGASDDGGVGLCPEYGDKYFAAFVRDPDGYRIEAVCHE